MPQHSILVVDDSIVIRQQLRAMLTAVGYNVLEATDGISGLDMLHRQQVDVVLLDISMPGLDGLEMLRRRNDEQKAPVIVVSGHEGPVSKVNALDAGADDYVTKPFDVSELLARIRAMLRRRSAKTDTLSLDGLEVEFRTRIVRRNGSILRLSQMETNLLLLLAEHAGDTLSAVFLQKELWSRCDIHTRHALRILVRKLRCKIENDPADPRLIRNERGKGYRIDNPPGALA